MPRLPATKLQWEEHMLVKRFEDAETYEAPNHFGVTGLRLQGFEEGGPTNQWVGLSQFLPGGGAGPDSTPFEKIYVVLEGEMTVIIDRVETVLSKYDSCTIAPNEVRKIENRSNFVCTMLVVIPYPPETKQ
jgi:mannose-6-phosphate isomerase-like protein (cupin superfamily)